ncbi:Hypothetical predicted protein [Pelobates cultripes]|uniref:L1 transposable element RRM domain-containing protein n=1 Tax=Pelobates cultripes TaxID=61616 RepID=A0AAD1S563_PELCU|nr:Hypothetical predicted protein [Pelobates cultripes]
MGGGKKKKEQTPSVATLFRTPTASQRTTGSQLTEEEDSGPEDTIPLPDPTAPLTIGVLRGMLREATADIKTHVAAEITKQLEGLKTEMATLASRTGQTENRISKLESSTQEHAQDIAYFHGKIAALEDGMEDLNNRSRRNNIRIRGLPEAVTQEQLLPTLKAIFQEMAPDLTPNDLEIDRVHRALKPPNLNQATPRDIITRLHHFSAKEKLTQAARYKQPKFKGISLTFFQDLSPLTLKKRRDLKPLTLALQQQGLKYVWGHPFKLIVRKDEQAHILLHPTEMGPFAESLGVQLLQHPPRTPPRNRHPPGYWTPLTSSTQKEKATTAGSGDRPSIAGLVTVPLPRPQHHPHQNTTPQKHHELTRYTTAS